MFLDILQRRNPELIAYAQRMFNEGRLLPDTYVLDLDTIVDNAREMKAEADQQGIELLFMLKQIGRNPYIAKKLMELGYTGAVVVDYKEAAIMMEHDIPLGNVGHLVQIPDVMLKQVIEHNPKEITVYSFEKIKRINEEAQKQDKVQGILLRVYDDGDLLYEGQKGGFHVSELPELVKRIQELKFVKILGVTAFPCFLFDEARQDLLPTHNAKTLQMAKQVLAKQGIEISVMNMPSASCVHTFSKIKDLGGNQAEPGHALTGTTPYHNVVEEEERPALLYLSEISHHFQGKSYAYGGGNYRRGHVEHALVAGQVVAVEPCDATSIDYHFELNGGQGTVGQSVIMCFRTQIFVTRSDVAIVEGLHSGQPHISGIYDSQGRKKDC